MLSSAQNSATPHGSSRNRVQQALQAFLLKRRPRQALVVTSGPEVPPRFTTGEETRVVTIDTGSGMDSQASVRCALDSLPFQSRVFDLVLAHHVLCDGDEPALREFERVLEGGGYLVVLGLGYWCCRFRFRRRTAPPAAIRPVRLCRALRDRDFDIESCNGQDIAGLRVGSGDGWKAPLVAVSDQVMIVARATGNQHVVTPLRFGRARVAGARAAALDSLSREAAL